MNQNATPARSGMRSVTALASALALEGLLFAICLLGLSSLASAAVINIPAITFVSHDVSEYVHNFDGRVTEGVLDNAFGRFLAPVIFPSGGEVCSFSVVYRDDNNLGYVTAKLFKKKFSIGQSPFTEPVLMAALQSSGADVATRRLVEPDILAPKIDAATAFYYVELTIGLGVQVLGVQVNYRSDKCPP